ncbi:MAG TPA: heavy metal translocating P-type ATPase, partial [Solirubrobacteraceae bacterium]|nr:heavy metal translocating P-type ATPase [Solirubrobacteraceae bacterium]
FSAPEHTLVHRLPDRVRCRTPRVRTDEAYARRLRAVAEHDDRVAELRVNRPAASVVVRWTTALPEGEPDERTGQLLRDAETASPDSLPALRPTPVARWPRLALPAAVAGVAGGARLLGLAVPGPIGALAVLAASLPIARRAVHSLTVERRLNLDVLDMTAILLTTLRGSLLAPLSVIGLVEVGEAIRERTARASRRELLDLLDSISETVWVQRDGERRQVATDDVHRGDVVVVYPGDRIPVDGRVLEGRALIDEHQLTGEPMPVVHEEGEVVYASTLMRDGHLHIAVEQVGAETRAGRIVQLMREAPVHDTRIENYAGKLADRIVLPSFLLAGAVLLVTRDPTRAASILIADFATGIRVSVPTAVLAAMTSAAQAGVLIRSGRALEQLTGVDTVVFDKTGTITEGSPAVIGVESRASDVSVAEVLAVAATAEQRLSHPVAEAVVRYAATQGASPGRRGRWQYDIGLGVRAEIGGRRTLVGSDRLLEQDGVEIAPEDSLPSGGRSHIYVAIDGRLCGVIAYADPIRPEAQQVIRALRDRHDMEIHLMTGDKRETAYAVGRDLGIAQEDVHGELFPEQKAELLRRLRANGRRVAFVGDGINDLPALAYADVSVSFGGATAVARETADVVLVENSLHALPTAVSAARQAMRLVRQNIAIVGGVNLTALTVATATGLSPTAAAVVHNGSTVVAALNGLRPMVGADGRRRPERFDDIEEAPHG